MKLPMAQLDDNDKTDEDIETEQESIEGERKEME